MVFVHGWSLPDQDRHFVDHLTKAPQWQGRAIYQSKALDAALASCKMFRRAVDIGAHVGLWSWVLSQRFKTVDSFEPVEEFRAHFVQNVTAPNVKLHPAAIGSRMGKVKMAVQADNTGMTHIQAGAPGDVLLRPLDYFKLKHVDLMKVDVEGFETEVVMGARETLGRCRPIIVIEQKTGAQRYGFAQTQAVELLQSMGAVLLHRVNDDYVMGWNK